MKAVRVHQFGGLDSVHYEDILHPTPGVGQVLVRVKAAGVGPWDALVREGKSALRQLLPLTLGADLAGVVEEVGSGVIAFCPGDDVFGVTNSRFTGAYAEYAVVDANKIAKKPRRLDYVEAASVPVVAVTAWQMVFDQGAIDRSKRVLVLGAAGNVGAYAVQLAKRTEAVVLAAVHGRDAEYVRTLGADEIINVQITSFEESALNVDVVLDTVGGETLARSFAVLKPGGTLVSIVSPPDPEEAAQRGVRGVFFIVQVTTESLNKIADLLDTNALETHVGEVLPLSEARRAHEMLAGSPHKPGKIVLLVDA